MIRIPVTLKYNLENEMQHLDIYDAGIALLGAARSLAIPTHYFVNRKVIKQAPALHGATINVHPPTQGSFLFPIEINITSQQLVEMAISGVIGTACWEFLRLIFSLSIGKHFKPQSAMAASIASESPGDIDALTDTIENHVADMHRPLMNGATSAVLYTGADNIAYFDHDSLDYLQQGRLSKDIYKFIVSIPSFNINSGRGRAYLKSEMRTVPFKHTEDNFSDNDKSLLAWSLNEYANKRIGLIHMYAKVVSTPKGLIKSLRACYLERIED